MENIIIEPSTSECIIQNDKLEICIVNFLKQNKVDLIDNLLLINNETLDKTIKDEYGIPSILYENRYINLYRIIGYKKYGDLSFKRGRYLIIKDMDYNNLCEENIILLTYKELKKCAKYLKFAKRFSMSQKEIFEHFKKENMVLENNMLINTKIKRRKDNYPIIHKRIRGVRLYIYVHRYIAYLKYGDIIFTKGIVVRHLDGDKNNFNVENIFIGTQSDNMYDMSFVKRSNRKKGKTHNSKLLSEEEILFIKNNSIKNGGTFTNKQLSSMFGKCQSMISRIINETALTKHRNKISVENIIYIRKYETHVCHTELANKYGVNEKIIYNIINFRTFKFSENL